MPTQYSYTLTPLSPVDVLGQWSTVNVYKNQKCPSKTTTQTHPFLFAFSLNVGIWQGVHVPGSA